MTKIGMMECIKTVDFVVLERDGVTIKGSLVTNKGTPTYSGYINGKFVEYSESDILAKTIRAVNHKLEEAGV